MLSQQSDQEQLLLDIQDGSASAFEKFYEQHMPMVYRIALRMLKDPMEAEDLCHDVFVEVMHKLEQFDSRRGSVEAWLAIKTRSRCIDRLRLSHRLQIGAWEYDDARHVSGMSVEEAVVDKLYQDRLQAAFQQIPPAQKKALYGLYFEGKTHRELAKMMKRPLGTVKSLIRYGVLNIKKQFAQEGWLEPSGGGKRHD